VTASTYLHWIDGRAVAGKSGRVGDVFNPSLGVVAAHVARNSSKNAAANWRASSPPNTASW